MQYVGRLSIQGIALLCLVSVVTSSAGCKKDDEKSSAVASCAVESGSESIGATANATLFPGEKLGQTLKVSFAASVTEIRLYAITAGVTRMDAEIHEGSPGSSTLIASSSTTSGLGSGSLAWVSIPIPSKPKLKSGTTYTLVFWADANFDLGYEDVTGGSALPSGSMWYYGGTWTEIPTLDGAIGVSYEKSCP